jgi:hypothetical protein
MPRCAGSAPALRDAHYGATRDGQPARASRRTLHLNKSNDTGVAMQCADAAGFQVAAALEAYEEQLVGVCRESGDPARTGRLQAALRKVCSCCLGLPQLSAAALALLIAHHRFLADLSRSGGDPAAPAPACSLRIVEQCVQFLKRHCREMFLAPHLH